MCQSKLTIQRFVCNMFQENTYVVSDETHEAVIIDCGAYYDAERQAIIRYIDGAGLKPVHLLATHAHIDHNIGNDTIADHYGLHPEVCADDEKLMGMLDTQANVLCGISLDHALPPVARYFRGGDNITFGSHQFKVIATPGHSPGCVVFHCEAENVAFTGDTLFRGSIGRTDFWQGSFSDIVTSLRRLVTNLPPETTLYPGHGPQTTIDDERKNNPYIQ